MSRRDYKGGGTLPGGGKLPPPFDYKTSPDVKAIKPGSLIPFSLCPICLSAKNVEPLGMGNHERVLYMCKSCGGRFYATRP